MKLSSCSYMTFIFCFLIIVTRKKKDKDKKKYYYYDKKKIKKKREGNLSFMGTTSWGWIFGKITRTPRGKYSIPDPINFLS